MGGNSSKPVTITLHVRDAATLFEAGQSAVDAQCYLSDTNNGSTPNGKVEDFVSDVYIAKKVTWDGAPTTSGYSVAITSIVYENLGTDVNFFDNGTLIGEPVGGKNSKVKDKQVKNETNLVGKTDVYTIHFQVFSGNTPSTPLKIDPKLRGNN